jgi:hypothetical protein
MRMGIGGHHRPRGLFDTWLTDRAILQSLGKFDLDPCAAPDPRPWDTADRHIALPEDGLSIDWTGRVWLNPPYHRDLIGAWMEKMANHRERDRAPVRSHGDGSLAALDLAVHGCNSFREEPT